MAVSEKLGRNPYETLANSIVIQAVFDYRKALKKIGKDPKDQEALEAKAKIERFFQSGWYQALTRVNGPYLMRKLWEEVETR